MNNLPYINLALEPGDATRYQIAMCLVPDGVFVGLGYSDVMRGGYIASQGLLHEVPDMLTQMSRRRLNWDYHAIGYWHGHTGFDNKHTSFVALAMAWLYWNSPVNLDERSRIIGFAHNGKIAEFDDAMEWEMQIPSEALRDISYETLLLKALSFARANMEVDDVYDGNHSDGDEIDLSASLVELHAFFGGEV